VVTGTPPASPTPPIVSIRSLAEIVSQVRKKVQGVPLSAIILGWPSPAAVRFFGDLRALLIADDRVWFVRDLTVGETTPAPAIGVLLDPRSDLDAQILRNQPAEILFLTGEAAESHELKDLRAKAHGGIFVFAGHQGAEFLRLSARARWTVLDVSGSSNETPDKGWVCVCPKSLLME